MTDQPIKLLLPSMPSPDAIYPWLKRLHANRYYTNFGPLVRELESRLEDLLDIAEEQACSTVCNATAGIELALTSLELPPGASILLPALSFPATATAVKRSGYQPFFADIDPTSWLLTPATANATLAQRDFGAVLAVAAFGTPQSAAAWDTFTQSTEIPVIVDAAGAFGNQQCPRRCLTVFSLHATKSLGCGEGGLAVGPESWVQRIRSDSNFGLSSRPLIEHPGSNAKMSEYHAAVALAALEHWPQNAAGRRDLHRRYLQTLRENCPELGYQRRPDDGIYTILPVLLPVGIEVEAFAAKLADAGIETRRWYHPLLPDHPAFADAPLVDALPVARDVSARLIGLPFHPFLSEQDMERIAVTASVALHS